MNMNLVGPHLVLFILMTSLCSCTGARIDSVIDVKTADSQTIGFGNFVVAQINNHNAPYTIKIVVYNKTNSSFMAVPYEEVTIDFEDAKFSMSTKNCGNNAILINGQKYAVRYDRDSVVIDAIRGLSVVDKALDYQTSKKWYNWKKEDRGVSISLERGDWSKNHGKSPKEPIPKGDTPP